MNLNRRLNLICFLGSILPIVGCGNTVLVPKNPYDGLLPTGVIPPEANQLLPLSGLKEKKAGMIISANFENYVTTWLDHHERGGAENKKNNAMILGALTAIISPIAAVGFNGIGDKIDQANEKNRRATDPRRIIDQLYVLLQKYFGEVTTLSDFGAARENNVDYIVLTDLHHTFNSRGTMVHFTGGLHLLDRRVRRIFSVDAKFDAERTGGDISAAVAMGNGLREIFGQFERGLAEKLK